MSWKVYFNKNAQKQTKKLKRDISSILNSLYEDISDNGPFRFEWPNYGKLKGGNKENKYHCHLVKGRPTYVCCWELINKESKIIEVYYVGTHENAPY